MADIQLNSVTLATESGGTVTVDSATVIPAAGITGTIGGGVTIPAAGITGTLPSTVSGTGGLRSMQVFSTAGSFTGANSSCCIQALARECRRSCGVNWQYLRRAFGHLRAFRDFSAL